MDFESALKISGSGMSAQRTWMNVLSANLANVNTTKTASGKPYERRTVIYESSPAVETFDQALNDSLEEELQGVRVANIVSDKRDFRQVYDPGHPDADANGVLQMPNITAVEEMTNMVIASRSYEANLTALNNAKLMALKAIEIGK
jgi:flagellar basal-body rod protein FlgC